MRQVKSKIARMRLDTEKEFNTFTGDTVMKRRIENTERLRILNDLAKFIGGIRQTSYRTCAIAEY